MMAEKKTTKGKEKKEKVEEKPVEKTVVKAKKEEKPVEKKEKKEPKKEKGYKLSRSPEASKMAREKSRLEKKKGKFKRQNLGKKMKVKDRWRRPRGIDSGHRKDAHSYQLQRRHHAPGPRSRSVPSRTGVSLLARAEHLARQRRNRTGSGWRSHRQEPQDHAA